MGLYGSKIISYNQTFRVLLISFAGMAVLAVIVSWRAQALVNAEYVEFPKSHTQIKTIVRPETDLEKQQRELKTQLN